MTTSPGKPAPKPPETFRSHLPALAAAAAGTVLAAVLGSLIGTAGTLVGMTAGSLISGTGSWWAERGIRRSAAIAQARAAAIRTRGRPLRPAEETAVIEAVAAAHDRARPRRQWAGPALLAAAALIGGAAAVTGVEAAVGKPLSAVVQGRPGHGTTLGGGVSGRSSPGRPVPGDRGASPSTTGPGPSVPASASSTGSSPSASPSPSVTVPASVTPGSTTPSAAPPGSAAPSATPASTVLPLLTPVPASPVPGQPPGG